MLLLLFCIVALLLLVVIARNHARGITHFKERPENYQPGNGWGRLLRVAFFGLNSYRSRIGMTPEAFGREFTVHELVTDNNIKLIGWHVSNGIPERVIMLVNWFGGCKSDNLEAAEVFAELGYDVFMLDVRGHGDSSGMDTCLGYYEYRDVLCGIEYVKGEFKPEFFGVYGVSLGAVAVMRAFYAAEVDGVDALILEAPFDRLINTIRHRVRAFKLPSFFFADVLAVAGGVLQGYNPYSFNPAEYAESIRLPVMLIHRKDDPYVSVKEVEAVFDRLKDKEHSELLIATDGGHGTIVHSHRELFYQEVKKFFDGLRLS